MAGGSFASDRKAYARTVNVVEAPKKQFKSREPIVFFDEDLDRIEYPHDDTMVIMTMIGNAEVRQLVGGHWKLLQHLVHVCFPATKNKLEKDGRPLIGFTGHSVPIMGMIDLPMTMGEGNLTTTIKTKF